ncbi:hypothetical protein ACFST9_04245 [Hymenobacter monticola]|uniref:Uncharacterized protein n=2 Tax=Hymenobacter monticola TaxID=1705399 RepID=A0ABY4B1H0_9BACT|nr:hypothetical protein [Hymenobacter monticola]UOE32835.1 hypothetical protein MTP16_17075 [Hymenobacter monticola]
MPINNLIRKRIREYYALRDAKAIKAFELAAIDEFLTWSNITWCRMMFFYANNEVNRQRGRVGRLSGFRIATRNLDLVPANDLPRGRNPNASSIRYYDVTRAGATVANGISSGGLNGKVTGNSPQPGQWRSFRAGEITIVVEVWSFERQKFGPISDFNA